MQAPPGTAYRLMGKAMAEFDQLENRQKDLIAKHLELTIEANKMLNLTRIDTAADGMLLHVEDSLAGIQEMREAPDGLYGDLGSGAGYPGIPLAIATGRQTTLVDSRKKKMLAVEQMIDSLGLSDQIEVYAGRAELLARTRASQFAVLSARALAQMSVLMELANPLLVEGGHLICYKAQVSEDEYEHARALEKMLSMHIVSDREFTLDEEYQRRIIVFEKTGKAQVKLPRLEGMAQKQPL